MEASMSISSISVPHFTNCTKVHENYSFLQASSFLSSSRTGIIGQDTNFMNTKKSRKELMVVQAKGKKGMQQRQFQRPPPPALPKLEDDGNPKFVIFIRTSNVSLWYPLSVITGGTTAKIMVAAKDNFLGKYIYKDTITRNIAAVIYRDEKEIQKSAIRQYRVLRSATSFRYGYKLVENNDVRAALTSTGVIELPPEEELKTVLDKVKDFFGGAKESFGKLTDLNLVAEEESESKTEVKS